MRISYVCRTSLQEPKTGSRLSAKTTTILCRITILTFSSFPTACSPDGQGSSPTRHTSPRLKDRGQFPKLISELPRRSPLRRLRTELYRSRKAAPPGKQTFRAAFPFSAQYREYKHCHNKH